MQVGHLDVWCNAHHPAPEGPFERIAVRSGAPWGIFAPKRRLQSPFNLVCRGEAAVDVVEVVQTDSLLFQVVRALRPAGGLTSRLYGRQEQRHQRANDGNYHQQLNERES